MNQETALQILKSGKNVFLTGSAGAGKTYVLNQYIEYLRDRAVPLSITASTGIAATHVGGQTIHSWSGLGIRDSLTKSDLEKIGKNRKVRQRLQQVRVLIVDEISMLSGSTLSCIDEILRYFKMSFEPFGGIQVIFSGDFFQLPPVSKERVSSSEKFAFMAPVWVKAKLQVCYLTESFRHVENKLLGFLNEIRSGDISESSIEMLQEKLEDAHNASENSSLKLFTHNADVDVINEAELAKLDAPPRYYFAKTKGSSHLVETLKKSILAPDELELKKYAQVIFVKNNYEAGYLNGTMGTIIEFDGDGNPVVETFDGKQITAKPVDWSIIDEQNVALASYSQIPLRLAWAITVHKSQGMTLDAAEIDLSRTFEPGQGYVALSRVKSWSGITLTGCNNKALQMDELVMRADQRFQELSEKVSAEHQSLSEEEMNTLCIQFICSCGGTVEEEEIKKLRERNSAPKNVEPQKPKISTYEQTKILIREGKNLQEIIVARELSKATIINHIEKLKGDCPDLDIFKFQPADDILKAVTAAIKKCKKNAIAEDLDREGRIKLGLIHRELNGEIDYDEIRLCRILMKECSADSGGNLDHAAALSTGHGMTSTGMRDRVRSPFL